MSRSSNAVDEALHRMFTAPKDEPDKREETLEAATKAILIEQYTTHFNELKRTGAMTAAEAAAAIRDIKENADKSYARVKAKASE